MLPREILSTKAICDLIPHRWTHSCLKKSIKTQILGAKFEVSSMRSHLSNKAGVRKGNFFSSEPQISSQCTSTLQSVRRFLTYVEHTLHQELATTNPTDQNPAFLKLKSPIYELNITLRRARNKFVFQWNIGMPPAWNLLFFKMN